MRHTTILSALLAAALLTGWGIQSAMAHCDTMDGPVVTDAKAALEKGDVTPVLKWVKPGDEGDIRAAFQKTLIVRSKGPEARELADTSFFERLVRLHRAGEGVAYTGILPAGTPIEPGIQAADMAVESGQIHALAREMADSAAAGIRSRFQRVIETKKHANDSVQAGREYVEAYVSFIHYAEALHQTVEGTATHHEASAEPR